MITPEKNEFGGVRGLQYLRGLMRGTPIFYGIGGVLLLWLAAVICFRIIMQVHRSVWADSSQNYWYYDSPLAVLLVVCVVFYQRPKLLASSRWRPRWIDLYAGVSLGMLVPVLLWLALPDPIRTLRLHFPSGSFFLPVILMGPIVEEILFRATFLKSFKSYLPRSVAVTLAMLLGSLGHTNFWAVLPAEFMLSALYVALGDSLPASICAHVTNNAVGLLLATGAFDKWHASLWSLWK